MIAASNISGSVIGWRPTMQLRSVYDKEKRLKAVEQLWENTATGMTEWRKI